MAKSIQIIPKEVKFPVATILDKESAELYQEVFAKTKEKFGNTKAFKTITNGIDKENVTGSQFFWNNNLNLYLPKNQKVTSLEDMEDINNQDESFFWEFYTDTPEIILRTETPSWEQNKYVLKKLVEQVKGEKFEFSPENPLRISNLDLVKDKNTKNEYGLILKIGNDTKIVNDKRFSYSNNGKKVQFGEKTKPIYTKENGLSRVCLNWDDNLVSNDGYLANSYDNGRVVLKDTEGVVLEKFT